MVQREFKTLGISANMDTSVRQRGGGTGVSPGTPIPPLKQTSAVLIIYQNKYFSWLNWQWVDNSGVLQWLAQELHSAEMSGEKVHIMSHIPPGNGDCLGAWGRNYAKIIERYTILI